MKKTLLALCIALFGVSAQAQELKLVHGNSPGGIADNVTRHLAKNLEQELGQPVIVDPRVGASGKIAARYIKDITNTEPTLMMSFSYVFLNDPTLDGTTDMTPIAYIGSIPMVVAVKADSKLTSKDLITTHNPKLTLGTAGVGDAGHLAMVALGQATKSDSFMHVPYKGSGQAIIDLVGGTLDLYAGSGVGALGQVQAGNARVIGVLSSSKSNLYPQAPNLKELKFPHLLNTNSMFIFVNKNANPDQVQKIKIALDKVFASKEWDQIQKQSDITRNTEGKTPLQKFQDSKKFLEPLAKSLESTTK